MFSLQWLHISAAAVSHRAGLLQGLGWAQQLHHCAEEEECLLIAIAKCASSGWAAAVLDAFWDALTSSMRRDENLLLLLNTCSILKYLTYWCGSRECLDYYILSEKKKNTEEKEYLIDNELNFIIFSATEKDAEWVLLLCKSLFFLSVRGLGGLTYQNRLIPLCLCRY